ncbi:MAG: hypothetical protein AB9836_08415 [Aminipila sp.]
MTFTWTLRDMILDALKDDGESIVQITEYIKYLKMNYAIDAIVEELAKLLEDDFIEIVYPVGKTITELRNATKENITDFWFALTSKGEHEWSHINYD